MDLIMVPWVERQRLSTHLGFQARGSLQHKSSSVMLDRSGQCPPTHHLGKEGKHTHKIEYVWVSNFNIFPWCILMWLRDQPSCKRVVASNGSAAKSPSPAIFEGRISSCESAWFGVGAADLCPWQLVLGDVTRFDVCSVSVKSLQGGTKHVYKRTNSWVHVQTQS